MTTDYAKYEKMGIEELRDELDSLWWAWSYTLEIGGPEAFAAVCDRRNHVWNTLLRADKMRCGAMTHMLPSLAQMCQRIERDSCALLPNHELQMLAGISCLADIELAKPESEPARSLLWDAAIALGATREAASRMVGDPPDEPRKESAPAKPAESRNPPALSPKTAMQCFKVTGVDSERYIG